MTDVAQDHSPQSSTKGDKSYGILHSLCYECGVYPTIYEHLNYFYYVKCNICRLSTRAYGSLNKAADAWKTNHFHPKTITSGSQMSTIELDYEAEFVE